MTTMPKGWKLVTLGSIASYVNGKAFKPTDWGNTGVPIIRIQNLNNQEKPFNFYDGACEDRYHVNDGDVLISWSASLGVFIWGRGLAYLNQHIFKALPNESLIRKSYFVYAVSLAIKEMASKVHGATMTHIVKSDFEGIKIPLPPIDEQDKIVSILGEADSLRKLRKQADDKMKVLVPALFDEMFGDPFGNENKWPVKSLEDIALDVQYGTSAKANENGDGIPVLRMNNVRYDGSLDLTDLKHTVLKDEEHDKYTVQYGDVLINRTNSRELVGKTAVWDKEYTFAFAGYLVRFRLDSKLANPFYVSSALNLPSGKKLLFSMAKPAVNMSNISASDMKRIKLAIPPVELQDKFAEQAKEVVSNQEVISEARQKLDDLFNSLMDRCMSGQIY